jgi:hypothetical protein
VLRSLRLQNFRSLRDTGDVLLRPIVLLVGANSSGKSSFLRFFPLLKQTAQANSRSPLLWFREERGFVDFRDFDNTLLRGATEPEIVVSGVFDAPKINTADESADCRFTSRIRVADGRSYVHEFQLDCMEENFSASFDPEHRLSALAHHGDLPAAFSENGSPDVLFENLVPDFHETDLGDLAHDLLRKKIWEQVHGRTGDGRLHDIAWNIDYGTSEYVYRTMLRVEDGARRWRDNVTALTASSEYVEQIKQLAFLRAVGGRHGWSPLQQLTDTLAELALNVRYIGPFRRAPARFYRQQEVSVDEIDSTGSNLAMFLYSLDAHARVGFSSWVHEHFGFHVKAERREAQVVLRVHTGAQSQYDLTDMGFGISQLLPVAAQCWLSSQKGTTDRRLAPMVLAIEQPELHLHPHHQFQLADMFVSLTSAARSTGQPLSLCIETHSEAMIHRFGELVEATTLNRDDITILFFEKLPDRDESTVRQIEFDVDGVLQDWPIGFFRG